MRNELAAQGRQSDIYGGGAEVHGGYEARRTRNAQKRGAAAPLGLGEAVFNEEAGLEQPSDLLEDLAAADTQSLRHLRARHRPVYHADVAQDLRLDAVLDQRVATTRFHHPIFTPHIPILARLLPRCQRLLPTIGKS
jgi:hypothetical protein